MVKKKNLHSEGHPGRFTELHGEEKREEGDRGDQEEKRGVKRGENNLTSNQFPKCSPQPGIPKEIQSWIEKRRGREEIEVTWGRKGRVQRGERNQASNHTPK